MTRGSEDDRGPSAADPVYVVFNPMSGKGRGAQFVSPLLQALAGAPGLEHGLTREPGDEARLTADALGRGSRGLGRGGRGCEVGEDLGIPAGDLAACAGIILHGHTRRIDVGRIEDKYFLNIAGFGYDVAVIEDSWSVGYLEGAPLYLYCA